MRAAVVHEARIVVASNAHYLTNAFGAIPGQSDSIANRRIDLLNDFEWRSLAVRTAEIQSPQRMRCCGRYGGPQNKLPHPPGGSPPTPLSRWLEAARRAPANQLTPFRGRYPRRHVVSTSDCPASRLESGACSPNHVYLGESCVGKMHFDCLGFLSYVFTRARGRPTRYSLTQWARQGRRANSLSELQPGDLVLWPHHACIVTANDGGVRIAHAAGDPHGVKEEPLTRTDIQGVCLPERFFRR